MTFPLDLAPVLSQVPQDAPEATVVHVFSTPLLNALGFSSGEVVPEFDTGGGITDFAARKTVGDNPFLNTRKDPYLIIEYKGKDISLNQESASYRKTVAQLKSQLLGDHAHTAQWGMITNSSHIQLFRKHGKTIFPASQCHHLTADNINPIIHSIKGKLENPHRALTITLYNNKGGVGKTTTTINLASLFALMGKKVLVIDFDFNQRDLSNFFGISEDNHNLLKSLTTKNPIEAAIVSKEFNLKGKKIHLDVLAGDTEIGAQGDSQLRSMMREGTLWEKLRNSRQKYDYILIDASPNWRFISQVAVCAADVVLIPTKHNNLFSLQNAAITIQKYLPYIQKNFKEDGTPIALPIFFNGEKATESQLRVAHAEMTMLIKAAKKSEFDLLPYFFPKFTPTKKDPYVFELPSYAGIASSAFAHIPAVFRDRSAYDYYVRLAREYFL